MLSDFANEIEEIIQLAGGSNATLAQVRQDLAGIVERMRAAQQSVQPTIESVGSAPAVVVESKVASPAESG